MMAVAPGVGIAGLNPGWPTAGLVVEPDRFGFTFCGVTALGVPPTNIPLVWVTTFPAAVPLTVWAQDLTPWMGREIARTIATFQILIKPHFRSRITAPVKKSNGPLASTIGWITGLTIAHTLSLY